MHKPISIGPIIYPLPVAILLTYNEDSSINAMTAAWACPVDRDLLAVCLSNDHKTNANFHRDPHVTISFATQSTLEEASYFGCFSGNDIPAKAAATSLTDSKIAPSPVMKDFPLSILCRFDHEDEDTGMNYFQIEKILADEDCLDEQGRLDLSKCAPVCYDPCHHVYRAVGEELGEAYKMGKKFVK